MHCKRAWCVNCHFSYGGPDRGIAYGPCRSRVSVDGKFDQVKLMCGYSALDGCSQGRQRLGSWAERVDSETLLAAANASQSNDTMHMHVMKI